MKTMTYEQARMILNGYKYFTQLNISSKEMYGKGYIYIEKIKGVRGSMVAYCIVSLRTLSRLRKELNFE